jgi:hypothetical protein
MGKELRVFFKDKTEEQFKQNFAKWGEQDTTKLLQVCQVQLGQVTDQFLKHGIDDKFRIEIIHLSAVLYDLYGK